MTDKFNGLIKVDRNTISQAIDNFDSIHSAAIETLEQIEKNMKSTVVGKRWITTKPITQWDEWQDEPTFKWWSLRDYLWFNKMLGEIENEALRWGSYPEKEEVVYVLKEFSKIQSDVMFITPKQAEFINKYGKTHI